MKDLKIVYYLNGTPNGIRNNGGFLFFFPVINKYTGQEERYKKEYEEQNQLADFLLNKLKKFTYNQ